MFSAMPYCTEAQLEDMTPNIVFMCSSLVFLLTQVYFLSLKFKICY